MIEVKAFKGKLNRDESFYALPPEDYVDALNITHDAVVESNDTIISNVVANRLVENPYLTKKYSENTSGYNFVAIVTGNGNGTQTVTVTFDELPDPPVTALTISYFNGTTWVNNTGGITSPQSITIPAGDYQYRVELEPNIATYDLVSDNTVGGNKTIGAFANTLRNTIVFMNWNENGYSGVYEYNSTTRTIVPIFENLIDSGNVDVLGFTENEKISSINIFNRNEGDLLFFIDSLDRPTFMSIDRMKAKQYVPVTRSIIDAAKNAPLIPPAIVYGDDTTKRVNYLRNRFFRFQYRYVYDDFFKSTYSPISEVLVPVGILDINTNDNPEKNNIITLSVFSGEKNVIAIEIAMSYSEKSNLWVNFSTVTTINKSDSSISDNTFFSYIFTNDSTYPTIDPAESDLLFDWLPQKAKCQELLNGNVLGYGAITEGYDKQTFDNITVQVDSYIVNAPTSGSLTQVTTIRDTAPFDYFASTTFEGIPAVGTTIEMTVKRRSDNTYVRGSFYTTVLGDTNASAMVATVGSFGTYNVFDSFAYDGTKTVNYEFSRTDYFDDIVININAPSSALASNSIPTWKWSTERNIGIAYFDKKGVTNGILYNTKVTFPAYADNISNQVSLPQINVFIYDRPPLWAHSYQFLFTKENTYAIYWATSSVDTSETNYIYFEVTGFVVNAERFPTTANVLTYTFQDGDRLRLIKPLSQPTYYSDDFDTEILGYLDSPVINGVAQTGKRYLKINKSTVFNISYTQNNYEIEIYRPQQPIANDANQTYYEAGLQFDILNPETSVRVHAGQITDQSADLVTPASFQFRNGDWYFRPRSIALSNSGTATFNVMDRNIVDVYISGVNSIDGRPNLIELNARNAFYGATVRHGQAYQPNTNINGLNRFYPQDFLDVDYSYGDIVRLKTRDRFIRCFQTLKIGSIPLFNKIGKSLTGDEVVIQTNTLLNPIQYYVGDWGIGTAACSLASFNFADYFCDNIKGAICRVSNNGVEPISIVYKMNSWATNELPSRKSPYFIYGCFEQRQNNYVVAIEATLTSEAKTLTWDEEANRFDSFVSFHPEMMCQLGVLFVTFKDGQLWTHDNEPFYNNFYGTQYNQSITGIFNKNVLQKKTFLSVTEVTSKIWYCPEIETTINSYGATKQQSGLIEEDFAELEGDFNASFLRDINSQGSLINGDTLKGNWMKIKFEAENQQPPLNNIVTLSLISVYSIDSPLTIK